MVHQILTRNLESVFVTLTNSNENKVFRMFLCTLRNIACYFTNGVSRCFTNMVLLDGVEGSSGNYMVFSHRFRSC